MRVPTFLPSPRGARERVAESSRPGEGNHQHHSKGAESVVQLTPHPPAKRGHPLPQGERAKADSRAEAGR